MIIEFRGSSAEFRLSEFNDILAPAFLVEKALVQVWRPREIHEKVSFMNDDDQHLRWLTIGHYICAAITAMFACFPLIYVIFGLIFLLAPPTGQGGDVFPARAFGLIFALIGGAAALSGWAFAALIFAAGRSLAARKRHTFCIVMGAISCAFFPLGTVVGVFTILVLARPAVKAMFEQQAIVGPPQASAPRPGAWSDETFVERSDC